MKNWSEIHETLNIRTTTSIGETLGITRFSQYVNVGKNHNSVLRRRLVSCLLRIERN